MDRPNIPREARYRRARLAALIILAVLMPQLAMAQVEDGNVNEEVNPEPPARGFLYNGFLLSPEVFVEGSYDSNLYAQDPAEDELIGSGIIIPGARFKVSTPEPRNVDLSFNSHLLGELYVASDERAFDQSGVEAGLNLGAHVFPRRTFGFRPSVGYHRGNNPQYSVSETSYNDNNFKAGLAFLVHPHEGKVFSQTLKYDFNYRLFEQIEDIDHQVHAITSRTRWNFLFQTALLLDVQWNAILYNQSDRSVQTREGESIGFELTNINSLPLRASLGLSTLLWDRVFVTLMGGYGYTFYDSGENSHEPLVTATIGYQWADESRAEVSYSKNFSDTTFGNFYSFHRVSVSFNKIFFDRLRTKIKAGIDFRGYSRIEQLLSNRSDNILDAEAGLEYRFIAGFHAGARYRIQANFSDFALQFANPDGSRAIMLASYVKHLIFLNVNYQF